MFDADVDDDDELNNGSTIKRAPTSNSKESQQTTDEHDIDTNNNTLERTIDLENSNDNNNTLQVKSDHNGIPSVPRVHMGACFMKIFNQCPLELHASYCWVNSETRGIYFSIDFTISK